jgi:phage shock protein A
MAATHVMHLQAAADQWLRRAELAVSRGQDDLAREALTRRKAIQTDAGEAGAMFP